LTPTQILRHHDSLHGQLRRHVYRSQALGIRKPYYVYVPPGSEQDGLPLVTLLRGHEREWVSVDEDDSRETTGIEDVDALIHRDVLPPVAMLIPGVCSSDNHVHSCGIDMQGTWEGYDRSVGTGRFWTYLTDELMPRAEEQLPVTGGDRLAVGFSLGGYLAHLWATRRPDFFDHVGIYDGTIMWPRHNDPREDGEAFSDPIWVEAGIFTPAFGPEGDRRSALRAWNPTDELRTADTSRRQRLQSTTFWIACASWDGSRGNRDRARYLAELLDDAGIPVGFDRIVFHDDASHSYSWADRFLMRFLDGVYG
jgi:pimeloyl-ACP methyl ester carboxylesterase